MRRAFCPLSRGGTLFTLALIVLILALMMLLATPGIRHTQREFQAQGCRENLTAILAAKEHYVLEHDLKPGAAVPLEALLKEKKDLKERPVCPAGGKYEAGPAGTQPTCSLGGEHRLPATEKKK